MILVARGNYRSILELVVAFHRWLLLVVVPYCIHSALLFNNLKILNLQLPGPLVPLTTHLHHTQRIIC